MKKKELNYLIEQIVAQCLNELSYQTYDNAAKKQFDIIRKKDMGKNPYKYKDEEFKRLNRFHKFSDAANKARLEEKGLNLDDIPLINKELHKNISTIYDEIHKILKPLVNNYIGFKEALTAVENTNKITPIKEGSGRFFTLFNKIRKYIINQYILKNFDNIALWEDNNKSHFTDPEDFLYIKECDIVVNNKSYHIECDGNKIFINDVQITPQDNNILIRQYIFIDVKSLYFNLFNDYYFTEFLKSEDLLI